jgi:uncharacterized protein
MSPELVEILRCPETKQRVSIAPPDIVTRLEHLRQLGQLRERSGNLASDPVEAGLIREDGLLFFPIRNGIPVMLADEAFVLK